MRPRSQSPAASPGFQLWLVTLAWQRAVTAVLRRYDLTHVQFVLLAGTWWLGAHGDPPTQRALADHAGTDPMMTSQVLRRLESRQLVERVDDAADTRAKRVRLTGAGRATLDRALPAVERADADFFDPVDDDELLRLLTALATRWNRHDDFDPAEARQRPSGRDRRSPG